MSIFFVNAALLIVKLNSTVPAKFFIPVTVTVAVPTSVLFAYVTLSSSAEYVTPLYFNVTLGLSAEPVYVAVVYSNVSISFVNAALLIVKFNSTVPSKFLTPLTVTVAVPASMLFAYVTLGSVAKPIIDKLSALLISIASKEVFLNTKRKLEYSPTFALIASKSVVADVYSPNSPTFPELNI